MIGILCRQRTSSLKLQLLLFEWIKVKINVLEMSVFTVVLK